MDNGHVMRAFFKNIPNSQFGQIGQINCGVFDVFPVELLAQILSVCHDFTLINQTFKTFLNEYQLEFGL